VRRVGVQSSVLVRERGGCPTTVHIGIVGFQQLIGEVGGCPRSVLVREGGGCPTRVPIGMVGLQPSVGEVDG